MTLSQNKLRDEFRKFMDPNFGLFVGFPATRTAAIQAWTDAYDTYAQDAEDLSTDSVLTVNKAGFQAQVNFFLPGLAATVALEFRLAVEAYWTGGIFSVGTLIAGTGTGPCPNVPLVAFATEATSIVTLLNPAIFTVFQTGLTAEFLILSSDGLTKATSLAALFHTTTTTGVQVLISGLDGVSNPVTNTCTVF